MAPARRPAAPRPGHTRMFATVVPGLAALVVRELDRLPGIRGTGSGCDGRSDIVLIEVDRGARDRVWSLRTVEDLFVEVGQTRRANGDRPQGIADRVWRPDRVEKALSTWAAAVRPLAATMTFRVIARVLQERSFLRTDLRRALTQSISVDRPKWRLADPAQIEGLDLRVPAGFAGGRGPAVQLVHAPTRGTRGRAARRAPAHRRGHDGGPRR